MRLDKAISSQGTWSRSDVRKLVRAGRVSVDGAVCKDPGTAVDPAVQNIAVDGEALQYKEHIYLVLNKPKGYISATEDRTQKTVLEDLDKLGIAPVKENGKDKIIYEMQSYYFPHVFSEDYAAGWYEKVEGMQGENNTFYAGEVMSFGDMDETIEYSRDLVERFFN